MSSETGGYGARGWLWIGCAMALGVPGLLLRALEIGGSYDLAQRLPQLSALVFGVGIMGAAFLLSWTAEAAQKDVSAALAIAVLALIAVLPEYAVEFFLAWDAGANRENAEIVGRVAANVTGSNRLLIGLGWSLVGLIFWARLRRGLQLPDRLRRELAFLVLATLVSFLLFIMGAVALPVAAVLIALYLVYLAASSLAPKEEPELAGPSDTLGHLSPPRRRLLILLLFLYSALIIFLAVEPFVHGLVETGLRFGIDEFHLIQWLAPLASESPEMVVAIVYTLRANPAAGIAVLISAGVNQMTLLIGSMPFVYSLSAGHALSFPLAHRQSIEFLLTSALSLLAVVYMAQRRFSVQAATLLLGLFLIHLVFNDPGVRRVMAFVLLGLTAALLARDPWRVALLARYVLREALVFKARMPKIRLPWRRTPP